MAVRVCSFESRRCQEMEQLIGKFGGEPTVAPSMREVPLSENPAALEFARRLEAGEFAFVLFMTGVGAATLFESWQAAGVWEQAQAELNRRVILIRGPKPVPVLKNAGVRIDHRAPEPNTWREVLQLIDEIPLPIAGTAIAVQEYGEPNDEFYAALRERQAEPFAVPVYRWEFPLDVAPLHAAIRTAIAEPFDLVLFTSAHQVDNVLTAAGQLGVEAEFLEALHKSCIASIGPTCTERLIATGIPPQMEPSHPKMAHLIRESLEHLQQNRG